MWESGETNSLALRSNLSLYLSRILSWTPCVARNRTSCTRAHLRWYCQNGTGRRPNRCRSDEYLNGGILVKCLEFLFHAKLDSGAHVARDGRSTCRSFLLGQTSSMNVRCSFITWSQASRVLNIKLTCNSSTVVLEIFAELGDLCELWWQAWSVEKQLTNWQEAPSKSMLNTTSMRGFQGKTPTPGSSLLSLDRWARVLPDSLRARTRCEARNREISSELCCRLL